MRLDTILDQKFKRASLHRLVTLVCACERSRGRLSSSPPLASQVTPSRNLCSPSLAAKQRANLQKAKAQLNEIKVKARAKIDEAVSPSGLRRRLSSSRWRVLRETNSSLYTVRCPGVLGSSWAALTNLPWNLSYQKSR